MAAESVNFYSASASYELCTLFQNLTLNCRLQIGQIICKILKSYNFGNHFLVKQKSYIFQHRKRGIIFISDETVNNCFQTEDFCFHDYKHSFQFVVNFICCTWDVCKFDLHNFQNFCLKYFRQVCVFDLVAVTSKSCATRTVVEHSVIERCFDGFSSFR